MSLAFVMYGVVMADQDTPPVAKPDSGKPKAAPEAVSAPVEGEEIGGPKGPEPTRYGDWENKGIASDF